MKTPHDKKHNGQKAFTLVEMLVAIAVFMSVMVVAAGSIISIININNKAQAIKSAIDNVTLAIDDMARNIRSGTNYQCADPNNAGQFTNNTNSCINGGAGSPQVEFTSAQGQIVAYNFNKNPNPGDGNIQEFVNGRRESITSATSTVNITNLTFYVIGAGSDTPGAQPRIVITATGIVTSRDGTKTEFDLQTTASQRSRD